MVERSALESEIIRKCLSRSELQCSFVEYRGYKVVYRRYARYELPQKHNACIECVHKPTFNKFFFGFNA